MKDPADARWSQWHLLKLFLLFIISILKLIQIWQWKKKQNFTCKFSHIILQCRGNIIRNCIFRHYNGLLAIVHTISKGIMHWEKKTRIFGLNQLQKWQYTLKKLPKFNILNDKWLLLRKVCSSTDAWFAKLNYQTLGSNQDFNFV